MASPVNLSHPPSVVTPKFSSLLPLNADPVHRATSEDLAGGVGAASVAQQASSPRVPTPPAASPLGIAAAVDVIAPAPAPAPSEALSFAPVRDSSPPNPQGSVEFPGHFQPRAVDVIAPAPAPAPSEALSFAPVRDSSPRNPDDLVSLPGYLLPRVDPNSEPRGLFIEFSQQTAVGDVVAGERTTPISAHTPPVTEAPRSPSLPPLDVPAEDEAPSIFATVCNRISTGVTELVNWIASIVYPSSVEDVSGQGSVAVVQTQVQEESLSADAKKAGKDTEEEAPTMFTTVCGRISNFITAVGEWITSFFVSAEAPVLSESERRLDAAIQENEAAMAAARNAVTAARVAREAAAAAAGVVQTTMANVESLLGETADQSDSKVAPQSTPQAIERAVVEDSSIVTPQGESDTEALA